ncbi:hypothetical protein GCM10007235_01840 [Pseudoxanthomonas indica]|nr:hypothetical protein GCM10007235_01840 [Pseudoxanthomonas indica]
MPMIDPLLAMPPVVQCCPVASGNKVVSTLAEVVIHAVMAPPTLAGEQEPTTVPLLLTPAVTHCAPLPWPTSLRLAAAQGMAASASNDNGHALATAEKIVRMMRSRAMKGRSRYARTARLSMKIRK